jgi:hypothetical protein
MSKTVDLNRKGTTSIAVLVGLALLTPCSPAFADPVVWNGPPIAFTKPDFADWTQPINQDRLTDNVWLTRGDLFPLFNIAVESDFMGGSPTDTEWAFGPTQPGNPGPISASNHANLVFDSFVLSLDRAIGRKRGTLRSRRPAFDFQRYISRYPVHIVDPRAQRWRFQLHPVDSRPGAGPRARYVPALCNRRRSHWTSRMEATTVRRLVSELC